MCALFRRDHSEEAVELWEETTWLQRHRGLVWRTTALTLWGATLIWFYWADKLILYIKPVYHPLVLGAGVVLILLALRELFALLTEHRSADCCRGGHEQHHHAAGRLAALVVMVPLVINALVPSTGLASYAVGKRATVDFSALTSQMTADYEAELARAEQMDQEYPELTIAQILTLAGQDPARAEGRKFSTIGFVYHQEGLPADLFVLVRFLMWCCAADAQPIYLPVRWPEAAQIEGDRWVKVRGALAYAEVGGQRAPLLEADHVDLIKRPRNQYM